MRVGRRVLVICGVVAVVLAVGIGFLVRARLQTTPFEEAVGRLPANTLRASFTDWSAVRSSVPGADLTSTSSPDEMKSFLDKAFDKDLTTASALSDDFEGLAANYGITPLDSEWEAYGQAESGSVDVLQLSSDVDLDALEESFVEVGYDAPADGAGTDGVWAGSPQVVLKLGVPLSPLQQNVALVRSERLLLMSDAPGYLSSVVDLVKGDGDTLDSAQHVSALVEAAGKATVAELWADDFACNDLRMSQADQAAAAEGEALVDDAGGVNPLDGMVMAQQADGTLVVSMAFATSDQASADLQPRTDLASGPAPGQGGTFPDRFKVTDSTASDDLVTMTLDPVDGPLMDDLGQGPLLFATC